MRKGESLISYTTTEEVEKLRQHLKLANAALVDATENVARANKLVKWANAKVTEKEEECRRYRSALLAAYETPPDGKVGEVLDKLEKTNGFVNRELCEEAILIIRALWRANNGHS